MCIADKIAMTEQETHTPTTTNPVSNVLFVCNFNAVRSPMAALIGKNICGNHVQIESAGIHKDLGEVNPFTVSVMNEIGMDISKHIPKHTSDLGNKPIDLIVTLSSQAHQWAQNHYKNTRMIIENWPTIDPTQSRGNRENIIAAFRSVRDGLEEKIRSRLLNINDVEGQSD